MLWGLFGLLSCLTLGYLALGYYLGKGSNAEYGDETETEDLGFWRGLRRRLFFPFSHSRWGARTNITMLREILGCGDYSPSESARRTYCVAMAFLWPVGMLHVYTLGIAIAFFYAIAWPLDHLRELKASILGFRLGKDPTAKFEQFIRRELEPKIETIDRQRIAMTVEIGNLQKEIEEIISIRKNAATDSALDKQCVAMATPLKAVKTQYEAQYAEVAKGLQDLAKQRDVITGTIALARIGQRMRKNPAIDAQHQEALKSLAQATDICRAILGRMESTQVEVLTEARVANEPAAQIIAASRREQDQLLDRSDKLQTQTTNAGQKVRA